MTNASPNLSEPGNTASRGALLVIFLTIFIDLVGFGIVLPLLPLYADQFSVDENGWQIGALMASYSLMQFLFAPIWGGISDQIGRRPIIILGISGSVIFYTFFGIAAIYKSFWGLMIARIGAGIAGATIPTAQAYIADTTSTEDRTRGMALVGMAFGLGFALGPAFALVAITASGGQELGAGPGFLAAAFSAVALLLAIFKLPEPARRHARERAPWWNVKAWREAFSSPAIGVLVLAFFLHTFAFALYETSLSMLLKGSDDFSRKPFEFTFPQVVGTFAGLGFLAAVYQGAFVRPLSKRVSNRSLAVWGSLLEVIGFVFVTLSAFTGSIFWLFISFFVIIAGFGCLQPSIFGLMSRWTDPDRQGTTLGVAQSASAMARILGALISIPLLIQDVSAPYIGAAIFTLVSLTAIVWASARGKDFKDAT
jgi:MFS transporter, DHA1 family, tetracycline resistance protein